MEGKVPIYSINYDFSPMVPYAKKSLWIQTKFPVSTFRIGMATRIVSTDPNFVPPKVPLRLVDVVGTRVVLESLDPRMWSSLSHGEHWGYQTRDAKSFPHVDRNWMFGNGEPIGYLEW